MMKKILAFGIAVITAALLSACSQTETFRSKIPSPNSSMEAPSYSSNNSILTQYNELVQSNKQPKELISFLEENASKMTQKSMDKAIYQLLDVLEKYEQNYHDKLSKELELDDSLYDVIYKYSYPKNNNSYSDLENTKLNKLKETFFDNGYDIYSSESTYLIINYETLKNQFESYVSNEVSQYLNIMEREVGHPYWGEGSLDTTYDDLIDRINSESRYVEENKSAPKVQEVRRFLTEGISAYLGGSGSHYSGIVDFEYNGNIPTGNASISREAVAHYNKTIKQYQGSSIAKILEEYLNILKENNYKINDEVKNFVSKQTGISKNELFR